MMELPQIRPSRNSRSTLAGVYISVLWRGGELVAGGTRNYGTGKQINASMYVGGRKKLSVVEMLEIQWIPLDPGEKLDWEQNKKKKFFWGFP